MAEGWIKLHRKLSDNELWLSDTFTRGQAWIDLLILANHESGCIRKRGILVHIDRGQVGYAEDTLSLRWKWSRGKVRRFLKELESNSQISHTISEKTVQKNSSVSTLITIINYDKYQLNSTEDSTEDGRKTDGRRYRNKNEKNEKNKYTSDFLAFYESYPKHIGKAAAWKAWLKLPKDSPSINQLIAKIDQQRKSADWLNDNGKFIPHPATWLNGHRWEDEEIKLEVVPSW